MDLPRRNLPPKPKQRIQEGECVIEVRKTKFGKKVRIGSKCTKEHLQMLQESGQLNPKDLGEE